MSKSNEQIASGRVLITGATDGIGLRLAYLFAADGWQVIGTGSRTKRELPENWPKSATYCQADQRNSSFVNHVTECISAAGWDGLDVAVLNAAAGRAIGPEAETDRNLQETLSINLTAPIVLSHALHDLLENTPKSRLVLIGSVASRGTSIASSYAASKSGLRGFVRAIASEWRGKIEVRLIEPPAVATNMYQKAGMRKSWINHLFLDADYAARCIYRMIRSDKRRSRLKLMERIGGLPVFQKSDQKAAK